MTITPAEFRKVLLIDTDDGPKPLAAVADDFQRVDFEATDRGWMVAAGVVEWTPDVILQAYLERGRGHSKTTDNAVQVVYATATAADHRFGVVAAGDKEQAALLRDAVDKLVRLNPWLADLIEVQRDRILNRRTGTETRILSSDAPTSYGLTINWAVCDELTNWASSGLWDSIYSATAKKRGCQLTIISNAGMGQGKSWQWKVREEFRTNSKCYFHSLNGPVAKRITPDRLEQQRRLLPDPAFRRLWLNQWASEMGDAFSTQDIEAATVLPGPQAEYNPQWAPYVLAFDLARRRDFCAAVVAGFGGDVLRIAAAQSWKPPRPGQAIDLEQVFVDARRMIETFRVSAVFFDPAEGGEALAQRLQFCCPTLLGTGELPFTPQNCHVMATALTDRFVNRGNIELYRDEELIDGLLRLQIAERITGLKLVAKRDETLGHIDKAIALSILAGGVVKFGGNIVYRIVNGNEPEYDVAYA